MIKAKALCPAENNDSLKIQKTDGGIQNLVAKNQNMVIESYSGVEDSREWLTSLAVLLVKHDALLKNFISRLRSKYNHKQKEFSFSISAYQPQEKKIIRDIFKNELCGVVSNVDACKNDDMIAGNLVFSTEAMKFLYGQYMEIGVFEIIKEVMEELSGRLKTPYHLYRNVVVTTKEGCVKNEFDIVIECGGYFYVVEVKSGKEFDDWDSLREIGKQYGIVPKRLLLLDSYLTDVNAKRIEYFCEYYVSNLEGDSLKEKVIEMISNDL